MAAAVHSFQQQVSPPCKLKLQGMPVRDLIGIFRGVNEVLRDSFYMTSLLLMSNRDLTVNCENYVHDSIKRASILLKGLWNMVRPSQGDDL